MYNIMISCFAIKKKNLPISGIDPVIYSLFIERVPKKYMLYSCICVTVFFFFIIITVTKPTGKVTDFGINLYTQTFLKRGWTIFFFLL